MRRNKLYYIYVKKIVSTFNYEFENLKCTQLNNCVDTTAVMLLFFYFSWCYVF